MNMPLQQIDAKGLVTLEADQRFNEGALDEVNERDLGEMRDDTEALVFNLLQ